MNGTKMMSAAAAADRLGVSTRTVTRWCDQGRIKGAAKMGRQWRISSDLIEEYREHGVALDARKE